MARTESIAWSAGAVDLPYEGNVADGKTDRRSISIIFHDDAGNETGRMNFYHCWPVKHTMPSSAEMKSGHAAETIELSYDWLEWKGK